MGFFFNLSAVDAHTAHRMLWRYSKLAAIEPTPFHNNHLLQTCSNNMEIIIKNFSFLQI